MVTSGEVNTQKGLFDTNMTTCDTKFKELATANEWEGYSFNQLSSKVGTFTNTAKNTVDPKMDTLASIADIYSTYRQHSEECDKWRDQKAAHSSHGPRYDNEGNYMGEYCNNCGMSWPCPKYIEAEINIKRLICRMKEDVQLASSTKAGFSYTSVNKVDGGGLKDFSNANWTWTPKDLEQA